MNICPKLQKALEDLPRELKIFLRQEKQLAFWVKNAQVY
jgi:hypothetical protein